MVVKSCPTCKGTGYCELAPPSKDKGGNRNLVQVDVARVLELLREGRSYREVERRLGISDGTVKAIGSGTWAGFRKTRK